MGLRLTLKLLLRQKVNVFLTIGDKIMITTMVRIRHTDGFIQVVELSHSQLCELLQGAPTRRNDAFWNGEESVTNTEGTNIKIITKVRAWQS
jgi:hypothetical protein